MKTIEYRVQYTGARAAKGSSFAYSNDGSYGVEHEVVRVQARDINSGYAKAIKLALVPLGNGVRREVGSVEFWAVTS